MSRELVIYCDESVSKGEFYSNFYGGMLIESHHLEPLIQTLQSAKDDAGLRAELKWQSITPSIGKRYCELMDVLFHELEEGRAKIRIMFRDNRFQPRLTTEQRRNSYHLLYYQFLKHAFGLHHGGIEGSITGVRVLLDKMPTNQSDTEKFRQYLARLSRQPQFSAAEVEIREDQIQEIDSKRHIALQYLDVVLGAMAFRLNRQHRAIPPGKRIRGNRTREKERVYKHIHSRIAAIYPGFNIGITTGGGTTDSRWHHAYRHWSFRQSGSAPSDR